MSAILPSYEYDIFISYRQKDNRSDQWVTNFVQALKEELDATFKEDLSVYFDENPHDGLHDTHDVNASLKEKVKCLIFIPIVSRTYCDPKSFAWQKEFLPFLDFAKNDGKGLKIKLSNGNVTSRVLPIRIHDLDAEDVELFEKETGSVIRSINFVYSGAGVNRPLLTTDKKEDNINKSYYRDQINKVAMTVKGIIYSQNREGITERKTEEKTLSGGYPRSLKGKSKLRVMTIMAAIVLLSIIGFYLWGRESKTNDEQKINVQGIAIVPFKNFTGDEAYSPLGIGLASELHNEISVLSQFDFISALSSTLKYRDVDTGPITIGDELGVSHVITGIYTKQGVNIELVETSSGRLVKSASIPSPLNDIRQLKKEIRNNVFMWLDIKPVGTKKGKSIDLRAYSYVSQGNEHFYNFEREKAIDDYKNALAVDSSYLSAWLGLAEVYGDISFYPIDDSIAISSELKNIAEYVKDNFEESWETLLVSAIYEFRGLKDYEKTLATLLKVLEKNPESYLASLYTGDIYSRDFQFVESFQYTLKAININPGISQNWNMLGGLYVQNGELKNANRCFEEAWKLNKFNKFNVNRLYKFLVWDKSLEKLPDEIKEKNWKGYSGDLFAQNQQWEELLKYSDTVSLDANYSLPDKLYHRSVAFYNLYETDSSRHYARKFLALNNQGHEGKSINAINGNYLHMAGILGDSTMFFSDKSLGGGHRPKNDKSYNCYIIQCRIAYQLLQRKYTRATLLFNELVTDCGSSYTWDWLKIPVYDACIRESPEFRQAVENIVRPPTLEDQMDTPAIW